MADSKLTALSEVSVPALEDLLYLVDDPSGTPVSNKVTAQRLLGQMLPSICQGRLTLVSGVSAYTPQSATPSSTDTGTEVITFAAAHGWATGTVFITDATVGGLTAGTVYWLNALSTTTIAVYTSLANALADSSRVNLTASITGTIVPLGVGSTTLYFTPYSGDRVALYDGTRWRLYSFTERSLALSALTSGLPYDVFLYDNAGTLTLELTAWTDVSTRATALATQDGVYVRSGATARRYLGTIHTTGTTSTEDSSRMRFVWNVQNRLPRSLKIIDATASWTYTTDTWRQANGSALNQVQIVRGLNEDNLLLECHHRCGNTNVVAVMTAIGLDATIPIPESSVPRAFIPSANATVSFSASYTGAPSPGYHFFTWLERSGATGTTTWNGETISTGAIVRTGLYGELPA
jgi:hypothetical protein